MSNNRRAESATNGNGNGARRAEEAQAAPTRAAETARRAQGFFERAEERAREAARAIGMKARSVRGHDERERGYGERAIGRMGNRDFGGYGGSQYMHDEGWDRDRDEHGDQRNMGRGYGGEPRDDGRDYRTRAYGSRDYASGREYGSRDWMRDEFRSSSRERDYPNGMNRDWGRERGLGSSHDPWDRHRGYAGDEGWDERHAQMRGRDMDGWGNERGSYREGSREGGRWGGRDEGRGWHPRFEGYGGRNRW